MEYISAISAIAGGALGICTVVGSYNMGAYDERKSQLINGAIRGETITLDADDMVYRTTGDKIFGFLDGSFGSRLAERRFKAGKFDKAVRRYILQSG